jgi:hypothetical protein
MARAKKRGSKVVPLTSPTADKGRNAGTDRRPKAAKDRAGGMQQGRGGIRPV